jgi:tRNA uridine 5-carboxymethylaminomethyl modification enzyme
MFTSSAEYRLLLRQDNAAERLLPRAREVESLDADEMARLEDSVRRRGSAMERMRSVRITRPAHGGGDGADRVPIASAVRDGRLSIDDVCARPELADLGAEAIESAAIEVRYEGYIERQKREVERARRGEQLTLPDHLFEEPLKELSREAREKLRHVRPTTIAQASRIPGMSPADVAVLLIYAERERRSGGRETDPA